MASDSIEYRSLSLSDWSSVTAIEGSAFTDSWTADMVLSELKAPRSHAFGAESQPDQLIGYALFRLIDHTAELTRIAVAGEFQRRDIGGELLRYSLRKVSALGALECFLEVRSTNAAAQKLYRRQGFHVAGRRRRYYRDGTDALVLRCTELPSRKAIEASSGSGT